jgi:DNA-binding CsgD family transcriptional regulator
MSLFERFASVLEAGSTDELLSSLVSFTKRLGFDTVTAIAVLDHPRGQSQFFAVDNAPEELMAIVDHPDSARADPVMQHCKRSCLPIVWDQQTYVAAGNGDKWETQAHFGYRTGIGLAMHLPAGRHFCIGVDRDKALPSCVDEVARMAGELQLLAAHAQDTAFRVLLPTVAQFGPPALTARESETLKWTMEGKTAWEVGYILGISEQTAVRHLSNATQKLGCVNKHQAVVKALRLGLFD